jgi:TPR repeat protein
MKKNLLAHFFLLVLLVSPVSWGADFQKGLSAAQNGDFATALREWMPLAEQGNASAQYNLALMYGNGRGVPQDDQAAVKWYRLAAEQGDSDAQYNLALKYGKGEGVPQDYKAAVKWYRLAAEQGIAIAQSNLGLMYANGEGVLQDNIYAHMWSNIAASLGNDQASKNREIIAKRMTPTDISAAQKLARECVAKDYKGC